ncbi:uncharacterized protein TNCV_238901 [Trichonephila clavipes]|nr:uncharacterized protein TNCV_238901 [Trichonephila clavipes]
MTINKSQGQTMTICGIDLETFAFRMANHMLHVRDTFGDRLISRFGPVNWSPRSCDLTPLDYFLWGYVKSLVYADKPQTLDHLEDNIRRVIADIRPQMLEKVIENWTSRLDYIRASPMPEIIFKILDTALNEMLCDAREFAEKIDIPANFELTQPRHRVRRTVNFDYEEREKIR